MAKRILIVKLSSLGDLFHALPTVHLIQDTWGAEVDWVTQPEYVELVGLFKGVDEVFSYPRRNFFRQSPAFRRKLRARRYDYVFDMQGLLKSAVVARMANAEKRIGKAWLICQNTASFNSVSCYSRSLSRNQEKT